MLIVRKQTDAIKPGGVLFKAGGEDEIWSVSVSLFSSTFLAVIIGHSLDEFVAHLYKKITLLALITHVNDFANLTC